MSLLLKEFKDNMERIILQSNSYEELCKEYGFFCKAWGLGEVGDDIFRTVLSTLESLLKQEVERKKWAKDALENQTGKLKVPRKPVINERNDY